MTPSKGFLGPYIALKGSQPMHVVPFKVRVPDRLMFSNEKTFEHNHHHGNDTICACLINFNNELKRHQHMLLCSTVSAYNAYFCDHHVMPNA